VSHLAVSLIFNYNHQTKLKTASTTQSSRSHIVTTWEESRSNFTTLNFITLFYLTFLFNYNHQTKLKMASTTQSSSSHIVKTQEEFRSNFTILSFITLIYLTFLYFIYFINYHLLAFYLLLVSMDPYTPTNM
jgi:fatty acid desaturase